MFNQTSEIGWKKRLAIVLSFLWIAFAAVVSYDEQQNSFGIFVMLGILPIAIPWGIAWVWWGFRKYSPQSAIKRQDDKENSHINSKVTTAPTENLYHNQAAFYQSENKWLSRLFTATSLVCFALFAGLLIHAIVSDGDIAYALGSLLVPSVVVYAALSKGQSPFRRRQLFLYYSLFQVFNAGMK